MLVNIKFGDQCIYLLIYLFMYFWVLAVIQFFMGLESSIFFFGIKLLYVLAFPISGMCKPWYIYTTASSRVSWAEGDMLDALLIFFFFFFFCLLFVFYLTSCTKFIAFGVEFLGSLWFTELLNTSNYRASIFRLTYNGFSYPLCYRNMIAICVTIILFCLFLELFKRFKLLSLYCFLLVSVNFYCFQNIAIIL